jgi:hypothetical protein
MIMNPSTLDNKARAYWEIARARILAWESGGGGGGDGLMEVVVMVEEVAKMVKVSLLELTCSI